MPTPPPRVSVVIPSYRSAGTLPRVLDALRPQLRDGEHEAVVVESSGGRAGDELRERSPWARVIALPSRASPGRARNVGARAASGEWLAFLDADAVPEARWLEELEAALTSERDAVAGAILNGTPRSAVGTAGYLLEFADWLVGREGRLKHAASANLLVRRASFEAAGGFPEDYWPGEDTVLTFRIAGPEGLAFAPRARVRHLNRTGLRDFLRHQRLLGQAFAAVCAEVDFPNRWIGRPLLAPLAVPVRLGALARRLAHHPAEAGTALALLPLIVAGLLAWGAGLSQGRLRHPAAGRFSGAPPAGRTPEPHARGPTARAARGGPRQM
jgi:GT2 family glycosyltransferase